MSTKLLTDLSKCYYVANRWKINIIQYKSPLYGHHPKALPFYIYKISWLLCEPFYCFILAVFISLLLQDLMMKRQVFHCTWRHMLLTVEKKASSALPLLHRHCRTTDYQIMCVRATHNKHVTGQLIINHSIINLKRIWYIWRLY